MNDMYTRRQLCLMNKIRLLWSQHVYWTRFFIISTAADLKDLDQVTKRLLENPGDFAEALMPFYRREKSERFKELLTEHLLIAAELVGAAKNHDQEKVNKARTKWYDNAVEIADFLAKINPCWNKQKWQSLLFDHLKMTEQEAVLRLDGDYSKDIQIFGMIEKEAMKMADYMSLGIIRQFCFR